MEDPDEEKVYQVRDEETRTEFQILMSRQHFLKW